MKEILMKNRITSLLEPSLLFIIICTIITKILNIPYSGLLLTISMISLALYYLLTNNKNTNKFISIFSRFILALNTALLLFLLNKWISSDISIVVFIFIHVLWTIFLYLNSVSKNHYYIIRAIVISFVTGITTALYLF